MRRGRCLRGSVSFLKPFLGVVSYIDVCLSFTLQLCSVDGRRVSFIVITPTARRRRSGYTRKKKQDSTLQFCGLLAGDLIVCRNWRVSHREYCGSQSFDILRQSHDHLLTADAVVDALHTTQAIQSSIEKKCITKNAVRRTFYILRRFSIFTQEIERI